MEFNLNDISISEKEIEIKLTYDEIKDDLEKEVRKESKKIQLPGFRKGKAPLSMLKKIYGDSLEYDASEKIANNWFWKVADENTLKPIGRPSMTDLKFVPAENLSFKVKYEVLPDIQIKDYKDINIEVPDFAVNDDEVQKEIDHILNSNHTTEQADTVADDNFIIDVEAIRINAEGEPFEGSKPEKFHLHLNEEKVHPDIKKSARNKKVGDSFEYSFKNETQTELKEGENKSEPEEFRYSFKILDIKKIILPELNEEFIKKVTKEKAASEQELREAIKNDIQNYYDQRTEEITRGKLISEIIKNNDFTPPSSLVSSILEEYVRSEEEQAKKNKNVYFNKDETRQRLFKSAETEVKWYLIRNKIIDIENLQVSEDELMELAKAESEKTGLPVEKLLNYYKSSNQAEKNLDKKLFDFLKENNQIKKVDPEKFNKKAEADNG